MGGAHHTCATAMLTPMVRMAREATSWRLGTFFSTTIASRQVTTGMADL